MTLSTLIALLQSVVLLLTMTAANPHASQQDRNQAFSLAQTAVSLAAQSLQTSTAPTAAPESVLSAVPTSTAPIALTPTPTPPPPPQPNAQPSCTLTGTLDSVSTNNGIGGTVVFTWKLSGMAASSTGKLYAWKPEAPNNPDKPWYPSPEPLSVQSWGSVSSGLGASDSWKAVFPGQVTCYAFFHSPFMAGNTAYFFNGATSSPTPLEAHQQSLVQ